MDEEDTIPQNGRVGVPPPSGGKGFAALVMLNGNLSGTLFELDHEVVSFGRLPENDVQLAEGNVSRRHFQIVSDGDKYFLKDNRSTNGTYLNSAKLEGVTELGRGDIIRAGPTLLKFLPAGDPERDIYGRLKAKTIIDEQTGCYSKTYLLSVLEVLAKESAITGQPFSLLLLGIDGYGEMVAGSGQEAADSVVTELARLLPRNGIRQSDIFARLGEEDFALILAGATLAAAKQVAERLRKLIKEREFHHNQARIEVRLTIAVAQFGKEIASGGDFFKRTEFTLYQARKAGGDRVSLFGASSFG